MRVRTDSWWHASMKRAVLLGARPDPRQDPAKDWSPDYLEFLDHGEEAKPGDVWVVRGQDRTQSWGGNPDAADWPVVGYGLVCPNEACPDPVHFWTHAHDCPAPSGPCKMGGPSCWTWTGSPEDGTLTASPSLYSPRSLGGCGWHGFLKAGELEGTVEA